MSTKLALDALMQLPNVNSVEEYGKNFEIVEAFLRAEPDKKTIRELDAELGDAKITIQASMSCTTHYSDLLKTCEAERDDLRERADHYKSERDALIDKVTKLVGWIERTHPSDFKQGLWVVMDKETA